MKWKAALALSRIGAATVPALAAVLKGKDKEIRWHAAMVFWAAEALGKIGPNARAAVPSLMEALKDTDKAAHYAVAKALKRIEIGVPFILPCPLEFTNIRAHSLKREVT